MMASSNLSAFLAVCIILAVAAPPCQAARQLKQDGFIGARIINMKSSKSPIVSRTALTDEAAESTSNAAAPGVHRIYAPPARRSYATVYANGGSEFNNQNTAVQTRVRSAQDIPRGGPNRSNGAPNMPALAIGSVVHAQTYQGATATASSDSVGVNRGGRGTAISSYTLTSRQPVFRGARPSQSWGVTSSNHVGSAALVGSTNGHVVLAQANSAVAMAHAEKSTSERDWFLGSFKTKKSKKDKK